jgi:hypothetical protein
MVTQLKGILWLSSRECGGSVVGNVVAQWEEMWWLSGPRESGGSVVKSTG